MQIIVQLAYMLVYFTIYSFIGWCIEVIYAGFMQHKFVNRGYLFGPFCPIYGFGTVFLYIFLDPIKNNIFLLFLGGTLLTSTLEYFTGFMLEKLFHSSWWDYTDNKFNLKGRICLKYSLLWGAGSVIIVKLIHPIISMVITPIPIHFIILLFHILVVYFAIDSILTTISVIQLEALLNQMNEISSELMAKFGYIIQNALDKAENMKQKAADTADSIKSNSPFKPGDLGKVSQELKNRYENILDSTAYKYSRLINAFPQFTSKKFNSILNEVKKKIYTVDKKDK